MCEDSGGYGRASIYVKVPKVPIFWVSNGLNFEYQVSRLVNGSVSEKTGHCDTFSIHSISPASLTLSEKSGPLSQSGPLSCLPNAYQNRYKCKSSHQLKSLQLSSNYPFHGFYSQIRQNCQDFNLILQEIADFHRPKQRKFRPTHRGHNVNTRFVRPIRLVVWRNKMQILRISSTNSMPNYTILAYMM